MDRIKSLFERPAFRFSGSDDPLSQRICWDPLDAGPTRNVALVITDRKIIIKPSLKESLSLCFASLFLILFAVFSTGIDVANIYLKVGFCCVSYLIAASIIVVAISKYKVLGFDKGSETFYVRTPWVPRWLFLSEHQSANLSDMHALQLIPTYYFGNGDSHSYKIYELNAVMRDLTRTNIYCHQKLSTLVASAQTLSEFLNVPLWNAAADEKTDSLWRRLMSKR